MKERKKVIVAAEDQTILDEMIVRLILPEERERFDRILIEDHYLHGADLVGEQLRYVVEHRGRWLALLTWSAAAYNLGDRDRWLQWSQRQRSRRLPLVANNSRFWILPDAHYQNLASRALKLNMARLSADWLEKYGHPLAVVESFVDPSFSGACYRASNWELLGKTKGHRRARGDYYVRHDRPKWLWVRELAPGNRELLKARELPARFAMVEAGAVPECEATPEALCGLVKHFRGIQDWRRRVTDYPLAGLVALVACATLCGVQHGQRELAAYAADLTQAQLAALGFRKRGKPRRYQAPKETTFVRLLNGVGSRELEGALLAWQDAVLGPRDADDNLVAFDGKKLRASLGLEVTSAYAVKSGRWLGSELTKSKSNEIPAARELLKRADIEGCLVAADALHTNAETARLIVQERGADYLLPVKGNQKTMEATLEALQQNLQKAFSPSRGRGSDPAGRVQQITS